MFGISQKPCRLHNRDLSDQWVRYMCGSCLAIKSGAGQLPRAALNNDAILLAVLVDAQCADSTGVVEAPRCAFRGFRGAHVVPHQSTVAATGAALSLFLASAKLKDDLQDQDKMYARLPGIKTLARSVDSATAALVQQVGLDLDELYRIIDLEDFYQANDDHESARATMEYAYSLVFSRAAHLSGRGENEEYCGQFGAALGLVTALVDACEDYESDLKKRKFNLVGDIDQENLSVWMDSMINTQFMRIDYAMSSMRLHDRNLLDDVLIRTQNYARRKVGLIEQVHSCPTHSNAGVGVSARSYGLMSLMALSPVLSSVGCGCDVCDCCCC